MTRRDETSGDIAGRLNTNTNDNTRYDTGTVRKLESTKQGGFFTNLV